MNKKAYQAPELELLSVHTEAIIATSEAAPVFNFDDETGIGTTTFLGLGDGIGL